jgi:lipopolysaccharide-induced tumor necrosis factor-alpha factor
MMYPQQPMYQQPMMAYPPQPPYSPYAPMQPMMAPMPPAYYPTPAPPQPQQQQTIIIAKKNHGGANTSPCPTCCGDTGTLPRKKVGFVTILWCLVLSSCGVCCIPFCVDSCKDTELICVKCQTRKAKVQANCC